MGEHTGIAWTDHTFNPWWGCQRASPACEHCYAESFAKRTGWGGPPPDQGPVRPPKPLLWGPRSERRFFGAKHWAEPRKWNDAAQREGRRRRVFCASMADVFEAREDLDPARDHLWALILSTPWLDWQLLTKRPENLERMLPWGRFGVGPTPWRNVWLGTTVEDQEWAAKRIPHLLAVPAVVRFVSYEPALGPLDLSAYLPPKLGTCGDGCAHSLAHDRAAISWVIAGGESGGKARPYQMVWANRLAHQCKESGVAFFHKQLGAHPIDPVYGLRARLRDNHGADIGEWPDTVTHVRQFPRTPLS